jgi:hypothetical protein
MREQPLNSQTAHAVLAELPVFTPDAALWPRIQAAHAQRTRARHPRRWIAIGAAAAAAVAAIVMVPRSAPEPGFVEGQRESQTLEREWQALPPGATRTSADLARLHIIDTALQSAYDRGAHADELQPLWRQRNEALRGLIINTRAETVTRI